MKTKLSSLLICISLFLAACSNPSNEIPVESPIEVPQVTEKKAVPKDTSFYFVKRILNASPSEVEKYLGKPDYNPKKTKDCDYLSTCTETKYKNGKIEVLYHNNLLKWIFINDIQGKFFEVSSIEMLNFPQEVPTNQNNFMMQWKDYDGIELIHFLAKGSNKNSIELINVCVSENYNDRFLVISDKDLNESAKETEILTKKRDLESAARIKKIEAQFNLANDGSHINITKRIKKEMNDPSSYKHISTKYFDLGSNIKVVTEFSGKNQFGANVQNSAISIVSIDGIIMEMKYSQ